MLVGLTRAQYNTGEVRAVRCVREVLGLQTYGRAVWECATIGTFVSGGIVGCVELHSWFGGIALQYASALRLCDSGSEAST